jgi:hypothetical protein
MSILSDCRNHLQELPFVLSSELESNKLVLETPAGRVVLTLAVERSFLSERRVAELLQQVHGKSMVFAPLVGGGLAERLQTSDANYVDQAGNLHLNIGDQYVAHIQGKTLPSPARPSGIRSAGYRVLFALMAWPELAARSQREISVHTGASRTAVAAILGRLTDEGSLLGKGKRRRLVLDHRLLQRWSVGYSDILRPSLFLGRYRLPDGGLEAVERRLEHVVQDRYAWGGGVAASRLGGTFIGERLTLHVQEDQVALPLTPSDEGEIHVLSIPGPLAWPGSEVWDGGGRQVVHPLLAYVELMDEGSDRALQAATDLADQAGWLRQ